MLMPIKSVAPEWVITVPKLYQRPGGFTRRINGTENMTHKEDMLSYMSKDRQRK